MQDDCHVCGSMGALMDERPRITHSHVRPYIIAILLHRGAVSLSEIVSSVSPHCVVDDLRIGESEFEKTPLEEIIEEVLGEMVCEKLLRYNEYKDIWVIALGENNRNVPTIISWASTLGAQIPHHFIIDMGQPYKTRLVAND